MLRRSTILLAALVSVCVSGVSFAQTTLFAHFSNATENPPTVPTLVGGQPRPGAFGDATFVIAADAQSVTMDATVFNLDFTGSQTADINDNLLNAHIHASATVLPNTNAGVVWGFIGSPFNDNNPNDVIVTPFVGSVGGTVHGKWDAPEGNGTTLAAQLNNLLSFHAYINFHTQQFGGGEIRGMIPEPTSAAVLLGGAFVGLLGTRRARRD